MKSKLYLMFFFSVCALVPVAAKVKMAASIPDLASIASSIGGDQVEVFTIAKSNGNPHFVEVLPSYMIKVSRVALFLKAGLALDQWADGIIEGSRNGKLTVVDCSAGIDVLEKPNGKVDASMGDVHPMGNPHYWLDPQNVPILADNIAAALAKEDPGHAELYKSNASKFKEENAKHYQDWKAKLAPLNGSAIITYHSSWVYFAKTFGMRIVGMVEPYPGIPPTAKHLQELVDGIKANKAALLIQEPYFSGDDPKFLARQTGIKVFRFTPSCEGVAAGDYWKHFDGMVNALASGSGTP